MLTKLIHFKKTNILTCPGLATRVEAIRRPDGLPKTVKTDHLTRNEHERGSTRA